MPSWATRSVTAAAESGVPASIRIKVNALHHTEIIEELYRASEAAAQIDIVARRIGGLRRA
jgi:polyphosphate kinase